MLDDLYRSSTNPSIAFLASSGEIKVRITAGGATSEEANRLIEPLEAEVTARLGHSVFAVDDDTIESVLVRELEERGWTVGTAESATAGLVAARITSISGSSAVFGGAIVAYTVDLKRRMLGVDDEALSSGVVSEPVALAMASGVRDALGVDVGIGVTGAAGPDPHDAAPGTMIVAVSTPEGSRARALRMPGDRERVRTYTTTAAMHLCRLAITGAWWSE
jgi:nicotinamide-nucleotide amidase